MSIREPVARSLPSRRRRAGALAAIATVAVGAVGASVAPASAAPVNVTDATFEWGFSSEMQSAPPFGGCNFLSAGSSDGTQAAYQTTVGAVSVVKNGAAPTWATKCEGASSGAMGQKVVWTGGTGTVDPDTGAGTLAFTGELSVNFYGGLVPFTIKDPVVTIAADGDGTVVATLYGWESSMENPTVKVPVDPVDGVVVADLSGADAVGTGFTVTPDYAGVEYNPPAGEAGTPQNRTIAGWGSWPASFVDFHYLTGLTSYWYSSGGGADPKKPPSALTVSYSDVGGGGGDPQPEPGDGEQVITAVVPERTEPGEFVWTVEGDSAVTLGETTDQGSYLQATGSIDPITVTDTRGDGAGWSLSGQVSDFSGGLSGSYLGWSPKVVTAGAGAVAGNVVASGIAGGNGLKDASTLAAAPAGHVAGTAIVGADLDLRLPADTPAGTYAATLTITALS